MNVSGISEEKNSYRVLGGKPDEKVAAWKIVRKWDNSIERDLKDIEWEGGGMWTTLIRPALMNLPNPQARRMASLFENLIRFSRRTPLIELVNPPHYKSQF